MIRFVDETVLTDYDKFVDIANQYHSDADNMDGINIAVDESAQGVTVAAQSTSELVDALSTIKAEADTNQEISKQLQEEVKRFKNIQLHQI